MHNVHDYSPYQPVFGQNPNILSVITNKPPPLEWTSESTWIIQHISASHAKEGHLQKQCALGGSKEPSVNNSDPLMTGMKWGIRFTTERWIPKSGKVHERYLTKMVLWYLFIMETIMFKLIDPGCKRLRTHKLCLRRGKSADDTWKCHIKNLGSMKITTKLKMRKRILQVKMQRIRMLPHTPTQPEGRIHGQSDTPQTQSIPTCERLKLNTGQVVTYKIYGKVHTGKIMSQAGKATGANKRWYNLQWTLKHNCYKEKR